MQPNPQTKFLCDQSKTALMDRPLFVRRLSLKDGTVDFFEIECLIKHIGKLSNPTDEQKIQLRLLLELKNYLSSIWTKGQPIPLMKEVLSLQPAPVAVAPGNVPSPSQTVNKPYANPVAKPFYNSSGKAPTVPSAIPQKLGTQPEAKPSHAVVSHFLNKLSESANPSSNKARLSFPNDRRKPATASPSREVVSSGTNLPSVPLSAALASHQCAIR